MSPPAIDHVLVSADAVSGAWTQALELAAALASRSVRTTLAIIGPPPSDAQRAAALEVAELHERELPLEWASAPSTDRDAAGEWLLGLERRVRPDIVHVHGYAACAQPFSAPVVMNVHACVCTWWRACRGVEAPPGWDAYRRAVKDGLSGADAIVAPTRAVLEAFFDEHDAIRAHAWRAHVIPSAIDPSRFVPDLDKESFVLAAGRLGDEATNVAALDAVASDLSWPVFVAGGRSHVEGDRDRLHAATALGVLRPSALARWMERAAVFALPARYEPFGLSALEAALSGCALVLGDVSSLREVWGDAACFVDPDARDTLRETLQALADAPHWRAELARRARERALELAVPERMAQRYLDLYSALRAARALEAASCA